MSQDESDAPFYGASVFEGDDDSSDFDQALDSEVAGQVPPVLSDGDLIIGIPDGDSHLQMTPSSQRTLFVAVAPGSAAGSETPDRCQVARRTADSASEDRTHDTPLLIEHPAHRGVVPRICS